MIASRRVALLGRHVRLAGEGGRVVDVTIVARDVEVAPDDQRRPVAQLLGAQRHGVEERELLVEPLGSDRAPVRDVDARHPQVADVGLDPARLVGAQLAGQAGADPRGLGAREDRHARPAPGAVVRGVVARGEQLVLGERVVGALGLLQAAPRRARRPRGTPARAACARRAS